MSDQIALENWQRYEYARIRGHRDFCAQARKCERFYLGGGEQWDPADLAILQAQGRPAYEFNEVMPSCNSAIGYQIHNRMDIAFKPRGGNADQQQAEIRSKIAMQIADDNNLHWLETQVFSDGLIQQRGYFDIRMDFEENMQGAIRVSTLDPLDVVPDPDAKGYDPDTWSDVVVTRWLTYDQIEEQFGKDVRMKVEAAKPDEHDFGDSGEDEPRNKFGDANSGYAYDAFYTDAQIRRVRCIDRQRWVYSMTKVGVWPETGDIRVLEDATPEQLAEHQANGVIISKRMHKRVKWTVSTYDIVLHDDWSPYQHFTVVPYFAYFRRGKTRGMVDNAIGPQEALNKAVSQFVHVINTSANSGWIVEENSLTNMTTGDLEQVGAKTGLVIENKQGTKAPEKIQPNQIPTGVDRLIDRATNALKDVTVPEAMRGQAGPEIAGIAIQAKQFASQQQLAMPLDNLAHTRHLLANRMLDLMQHFYTEARVFRITENNPTTGQRETKEISVNQFDPATGGYTNDLTEGEYDVIITEQPMAATFEDSQFQQAMELKNAGVAIPDDVVIRHSNLSDKQDILGRMLSEKKVDPLVEAQISKIQAEITSMGIKDTDTMAAAVKKGVEAAFSAMQAAEVLAAVPQVAPIADAVMQQAGYTAPATSDAPNYPGGASAPGLAIEAVKNHKTGIDFTPGAAGDTTPLTPAAPVAPATPGIGVERGIETNRADSTPGFADGGMVGVDGLSDADRVGLRYAAAAQPRTTSGDARTILANGGGFTNMQGQEDNLHSYNLAPMGLAPTAINDSPVHDLMAGGQINSGLDSQGLVHGLLADSAFAQRSSSGVSRFADGGQIQGPGTGTSDSIPAVNTDTGEPLAVSTGEVIVPADVVRALGADFFNELISKFHTPTQKAP